MLCYCESCKKNQNFEEVVVREQSRGEWFGYEALRCKTCKAIIEPIVKLPLIRYSTEEGLLPDDQD